ncbi:MAG: hypothetical protein ACLFUI_09175 [Halanaerobiales bacterium]
MPKELKLGGFNWKIEEVEHLMIERNNIGEMEPRTHVIRLDKAASEQQKEETLLHEIIEAINYMYCMDLDHHQIELLGVTLHQALKDNKLQL